MNFLKNSHFCVDGKKEIKLKDFSPSFQCKYKSKEEAEKVLSANIEKISELQQLLFASGKHSLLIILQSTDASGKDGIIRHVLSGINPQGCKVYSFRKPSSRELRHDWMWRHYQCLPERGMIGIFNRSYYENVLATKVHPEWILNENIPTIESVKDIDAVFWKNRYEDIRNFEKMFHRNGTLILKFFLHLSKKEQAVRFISRIDEKEKNWKISLADFEERNYWDRYQKAFQSMLNETSTPECPWHIIPADQKWFSRVVVSEILKEKLESIHFKLPKINPSVEDELKNLRKRLTKEK